MSRVDPLNPLYLSTILLNQPQLTSGFKRKMIAMAKSDMHASRWEAGDISPPIEPLECLLIMMFWYLRRWNVFLSCHWSSVIMCVQIPSFCAINDVTNASRYGISLYQAANTSASNQPTRMCISQTPTTGSGSLARRKLPRYSSSTEKLELLSVEDTSHCEEMRHLRRLSWWTLSRFFFSVHHPTSELIYYTSDEWTSIADFCA